MQRILQHLRLAAGILLALSSTAWPQSPQTPADAAIEDALVGTTWSGKALDGNIEIFLRENHDMFYRLETGEVMKGSWFYGMGGVWSITIYKKGDRYALKGALTGDRVAGTSDNLMGKLLPFEIHKASKSIPALTVAAPPPLPAPAAIKPAEFSGVFEAVFPKIIGQKTPTVKARLRCEYPTRCTFDIEESSPEIYDKLIPLRISHFSQARFALDYAREHKSNAKLESPELGPLLDSTATLDTCIDLQQTKLDAPGLMVLCKLDRNPWQQPVVIFMGSILANCGESFCRFGLLPMFRKQR
jgi:hypothetical protein